VIYDSTRRRRQWTKGAPAAAPIVIAGDIVVVEVEDVV
jgi:hypothetical protein